jgi:hypothetical protein
VSTEIPRQKNMFTDEWEDARSAKQRQLDYEPELAPGTQLSIFREDALAQGEYEAESTPDTGYQQGESKPEFADLLFDMDTPLSDLEAPQEAELQDEVDFDDDVKFRRTKYELYFELVRLSQEETETLWIDPMYAGRYIVEITQLALEARATGLSVSEIETAKQIGKWRGSKQKQTPQ